MLYATQDPDAVLDWLIFWPRLTTNGTEQDPIISAVWEGEGLVQPVDKRSFILDGDKTTVWASFPNSEVDDVHVITCHVITAEGREDDQSITFTIIEK